MKKFIMLPIILLAGCAAYGQSETMQDLDDRLQQIQQHQQDEDDLRMIELARQRRMHEGDAQMPAWANSRVYEPPAQPAAPQSVLQREPDHFCVEAPLYDSYGQPRGVKRQCY